MQWTCVLWVWNVNRVVFRSFFSVAFKVFAMRMRRDFRCRLYQFDCCALHTLALALDLYSVSNVSNFSHIHGLYVFEQLLNHFKISRAHIPYCTRNAYFVMLLAIERLVRRSTLCDPFLHRVNTRSKFNSAFFSFSRSSIQIGSNFLSIHGAMEDDTHSTVNHNNEGKKSPKLAAYWTANGETEKQVANRREK